MNTAYSKQDEKDISVELKLRALHELQTVVSDIDKIKVLRGELPLEVQDLEDEIAGLKNKAYQPRYRNQKLRYSFKQQKDCNQRFTGLDYKIHRATKQRAQQPRV